jgi:transcriptional antiterminator RfaH
MHWYLVHTKPRQEMHARDNLERQGYECFLPQIQIQKVQQGELVEISEPLFPRYLFIRPNPQTPSQSLLPVRSTSGVRQLVRFGPEPTRVGDDLISALRVQAAEFSVAPRPILHPGDPVSLTKTPLAGLDGIFQMTDGECRAMVLLQILSRPVRVAVPYSSLKKAG